jgi:hypothetical protein
VKVRIIRSPEAGLNDIDFEGLHKGFVYELAADFATFLLCEGYAELVEGMFGRRAHPHSAPGLLPRTTSTMRMLDRRRRLVF